MSEPYFCSDRVQTFCAELRSKSREVSELLTHYSRQIMGEITTVVFERLQQLQPGSPAADDAAAMSGVLPHISSVVAAAEVCVI